MSAFSRRQPNAVIASAATIGRDDREAIQRVQAARRGWQRQMADLYYRLAELHYPANYTGNALSRFMYPVGVVPEDSASAPTVPKAAEQSDLYKAAQDAMFALEGPLGGVPELARLYGMNMTMTGEGWLVGEDKNGGTEWEFLSIRELIPTDQGGWLRNPTGASTGIGMNPDYKPHYTKRFWRADPFATQVADAATAALTSDCQQLVALNESITSRIVTRLAQAGVLFLDTSLQVPGATQAPVGDGNAVSDPFYSQFLKTLESAIMERGGPSGSIPIIVRGQGKPEDLIKFITMDRTIDRVEMELRAELRTNIANGMDLPPEAQQGMGDATHFQAWQVGDATYNSHLLPEAQRWADGVTRVYLWPYLRDWVKATGNSATEAEIRRHVVIADGTNVVTKPNVAEDRRQLHDRSIISDAYLREGSAVGDEAAPSDEEYVRQLGRKNGNAYLATYGLGIHDEIDWDQAAVVGQSEGAPGVGSVPASRRPADSSDPAGAPGVKDNKKNASDATVNVFGAAASGYIAAAQKSVGAMVRGRCEPHPEVFAAVKSAPNEGVLARLEWEQLDEIGLTESDLADAFRKALRPMVEMLNKDHETVEVVAFLEALVTLAASRPTKPIDPAKCRDIARGVLSSHES